MDYIRYLEPERFMYFWVTNRSIDTDSIIKISFEVELF
jgi:hypothetical protein